MKFPQLITATILATTFCAFNASAQSFEGVIEFTKSTGPVSTMYKDYVKDDFVRIEELSEKGDACQMQRLEVLERAIKVII